MGGNDCKEKEVLFNKATFTDEVKEVVSNICSFSHPRGEKKKYEKRAPLLLNSSSKLALSNITSVSLQSFPPRTTTSFQGKLRQTSISTKCCYLKLYKIMPLHNMEISHSTSGKANDMQCDCIKCIELNNVATDARWLQYQMHQFRPQKLRNVQSLVAI